MDIRQILFGATILYSCLLVSACVTGGAATAYGDCAVATGGSASLSVSPDLRLSLGDSAIAAATKAVIPYLAGVPNLAPSEQNLTAGEKAVSAIEKDKGRPLTGDEKRAAQDYSGTLVRNINSQCKP